MIASKAQSCKGIPLGKLPKPMQKREELAPNTFSCYFHRKKIHSFKNVETLATKKVADAVLLQSLCCFWSCISFLRCLPLVDTDIKIECKTKFRDYAV